MSRFGILPAALMAAGLAVATGCKSTGGGGPVTKADALPFEVTLDGQPAVFKPEAAGPLTAVHGAVAWVEAPVDTAPAIKVAVPAGSRPRSVSVEVTPLNPDGTIARKATFRKIDPAGDGKLDVMSPGGDYVAVVTVSPESGAPWVSRVRFKTKPKA